MKIDFNLLNKERFEDLCKRILIAENSEIKTIDGSGGDQGVDSFEGIFNGKIKVYQFKFFLKRLNSSRKTQIKKSLKKAKEKHKLKEWILCLPMEFSPAEEKWFQNIKKEHKGINIACWNIHRLTYFIQKHKPIRVEFFKEEEKEQLTRIEKAVREIKNRGQIYEDFTGNKVYAAQLSAFKIRIVNKDSKDVIKILKDNLPFRQGLGFKHFKENKKYVKAFFYIPQGNSVLNLNIEDEENPFKLSVAYSKRIDVFIKKNSISKKSILPETVLTFFTSNYGYKNLLLKLIKENFSEDTEIKEINFDRRMKGMVSDRKNFALSITTIKLDPNVIEQIRKETGNIDVKIRSSTIHSDKGGLPKTKFMQRALKIIKSIKSEEKISDILFFRAKQTGMVIPEKIVSLDLHHDGRVRIWYKKRDFADKKELMFNLDEFIDKFEK